MTRVFRWSLLSILLCLAGCGPGVGEGPLPVLDTGTGDHQETDTRETDLPDGATGMSDSDTSDTGDTADMDGGTEPVYCRDSLLNEQAVFLAEDFDAGSRFVAMSNDCVLLQKPEAAGTSSTVVFLDAELPGRIAGTVTWSSSMTPMALTCSADAREAVVLFRDGDVSALYRFDGDTGQVTEMAIGDETAAGRLNGVHRFRRTANGGIDRICAFGGGVFCSEGSSGWTVWETELPEAPGVVYNDLSLLDIDGAYALVAVGTGGRISVERPDGWHLVNAGTDMDFLTVSARGDRLIVGGAGGVFFHGTADGVMPQAFTESDIVSLLWPSDQYFRGVTRDGIVFEGYYRDDTLDICIVPSGLTEPVLDATYMFCVAEENYLVLTETLLVGDYECASIVII